MNDVWPKSYHMLVSFSKKTRNSKYVSEENHRKHIAVNKDHDDVYHLKIDGGVIPKVCNGVKRIDFLLLNETKRTAYLIELKGCHIKDALEQIEKSLEYLQPILPGYAIKGRLVHRSRASDLRTHSVNKYLREHTWLIAHSTPMEETI